MSELGRDLHVALVTPMGGDIGGLEKFVRFLTTTVLDAGGRVTVALSGEDVFEHAARRNGRLQIERVDWLDPTLAGDRRYRWPVICQRRRWFRTVRPDVALFVQSSNTPFRAAVAGARLAGVPVVITHRTMPYLIPHVPSRRHLLGLLPGIGLHRRKLIAKTWITAALANRIVYNSHAVRRCYEQDYHFSISKGEVIVNAVQLPRLQAANEPELSRPLNIGYVGRFAREKRIEVLLRAFASLPAATPVRLVLYGEGPQESALRQLAHALDIDARIDWRGPLADTSRAYTDLDIVVLCSPRESSSNMIIEAMAAGRAVVVTNVGGLPELVDAGRSGLIVPPESTEDLAAALLRLVHDDALRRTLGHCAAASARTKHHPCIAAGAWLELLSSVAGRGRKVAHPAGLRSCPQIAQESIL